MGQLRQLAGQTVIYGASSVLGRVLNYLLVPLYTAVFAPAEYGIVTELYAFVAFLNILYTYGFETAFFRFATKSKEQSRYFNISLSSLIVSSSVFSGLLIIFSDNIAAMLLYPGKGHYITWLALILAIDAVVAIPFARLRLEGKALRFAVFKLSNIATNIGLNLFFLLLCPWLINTQGAEWAAYLYNPDIGVGYVFLSNLLANALYLFFFGKAFIKLRPSLGPEWKAMLMYSLPLMVMGFAGVTNEMFSRTLLKYWLPEGFYEGYSNQAILGIFGACYKLSVFMTLAIQAFRYAFEPFFFAESDKKQSPELFARVMHGYLIFACFSWMLISFLLPDLAPILLRRQEYLEALDIVPWLLGGGLLLGVYFNLSVWYKLSDQTKYGAWIAVIGAVITLAGNFSLIPVIGYMGSAITTFISYLVMVAISYFLGKKHYPIPYKVKKGLFYLVLSGLSIVAFYFCGLSSWSLYMLALGLLSVFGLFVWVLDIRTQSFK